MIPFVWRIKARMVFRNIAKAVERCGGHAELEGFNKHSIHILVLIKDSEMLNCIVDEVEGHKDFRVVLRVIKLDNP